MDTKKGIILVVVLLVIAALLFGRTLMSSRQENATVKPMTATDVDKKIQEIQNDPHMPAQAKAMAIGQLRAHTGGSGPVGGAPSTTK